MLRLNLAFQFRDRAGPSFWSALAMLVSVSGGVFLSGCSSARLTEPVHKMGELTTVGPVIYNVLETEWRNQLGDSIQGAVPQNKFLLVRLTVTRLTVTNSGNQEVAIPLLHLEDEQGNNYIELSEVKGVSNWLGLLRIVQPAATLQGVIVFDVPAGDYRLRVTDGGDLEEEKTALIEIPLTLSGPAIGPALALRRPAGPLPAEPGCWCARPQSC